MIYSGAIVLKALLNLLAGSITGVDSGLTSSQSQALLGSVAINVILFLYLAFWPGVKRTFEPRYY